jgi:hypothetical protein
MALNVWNQNSGYVIGTYQEQTSINQLLPVDAYLGRIQPPAYDGTGHHPTAPLRNSAGAPFARYPVNSYADGIHAMRNDLPNARTVSNLIVWDQVNEGEETDPTGYSGFMYAWGQFLTHDLDFARPGTGNIDVVVPVGDTNLTAGSHIPVTRNSVAPGTGTDAQHPAVPQNDVTGWIDASVVYGVAYPPGVPQGPDPFQNPVNLREGGQIATTGKLSTTSNGQYGPITNNSFVFGDPRGTENPDLTSIQTLMIREHNWHVTRLALANPSWDGERLYQRARAIVIAEMQAITYKEWLPKVVGAGAIPTYTGFKPEVDASIKIEFSAAALRFGHSIVSGAQDRIDEQGNITESLTLAQAFFLTPSEFERNGGADGFLRKLAADISNKLDVHIIEDLRNLLDDPPAAIDLAATNIQRGRDLGLPSLNQMRQVLGLTAYTSWSQITSDTVLAAALQAAYTDINDIDLWIGGLAEDRVVGAMVGQTFRTIIVDQFIRVRDGDAQWYENLNWSASDLTWLQNTTLADIILRNTNTIKLQKDVFVAVERELLLNDSILLAVARTGGAVTEYGTLPTFKVISGKLPPGLRLQDTYIVGSAYEVARTTEFTFCIRASLNGEISDRTYKIIIEGADAPVFVTPEGALPLSDDGQQFFVMDNAFVNYQLEASDTDTATGQKLSYFIATNDGELPPGLTLTQDGLIAGIVDPIPSIKPSDGDGSFDSGNFDSIGFDYGVSQSNGFDSYVYDTVIYDYSLPTITPKKLNRNYEFIVTVTDGDSYTKRKFKILVVTDDYFRADNTTWLDGSGLFTADVTYLRAPIWLTPSNLGSYRANNYITILLDVYATDRLVTYEFLTTNPDDNSVSQLPVGLNFDLATAEIYGYIGYQPAITKTYKFTVAATRYGDRLDTATSTRTFTVSIIGEIDSFISWITPADLGSINANFISNLTVTAETTVTNAVLTYEITSGSVPPGLTLNANGEIVGKVTQYGDFHINNQTIIVDTQGLLSFNSDQLRNPTSTHRPTIFDGGTTTFDRVYTFTVRASDQFGLSTSSRKFSLTVDTPNQLVFSNIKTRAFLKSTQRASWKDFINNAEIFTPGSIYRPNDPNFGVQQDLEILVYAGIEKTEAGAYISAMGLNHKYKRFHFGQIKKATAVIPGTRTSVYEVVYVEMIDPLEPNKNRLPSVIKGLTKQKNSISVDNDNSFWQEGFPYHKPTPTAAEQAKLDKLAIPAPYAVRVDSPITIDSTGYDVSDPNPGNYYPSSVSIWQERLKAAVHRDSTNLATERNYLPLWMRSIQPGTTQELGFTLAIPLCFCKLGAADKIMLNIKYSGFDFKNIDFTADRYIIDSVEGYTGDKYLVFKNDRITV